MTDFAPGNRPSPQPASLRFEACGSDNSSIDVPPSALISPSFIPYTPPLCGEGKNAMPSRAMVDMTSSRPAASAPASARASRDWQRPVSWRPFAAENPFASLLLAGALVATLGVVTGGVAHAEEATAPSAAPPAAQSAKPQASAPANVPLLLAQAEMTGGPQVSLMQPAYADVLKGDASILVGIQPGRYNAASIELFVDERSATGGPIPLTSSASTSFHWDTSKFLDGPHKLMVRVTDTQGFIGQTEVQVFVNNSKIQNTTPPKLSWMNAPSGALRGKVQLQLRAAGTFGVKFIMVSLNSASTPNVKPALATWFTNVPPYIISLDTSKYPDGLYVLSALGQNGLGEEGESQVLKIGIANNTINPSIIDDVLKREAMNDALAGNTTRNVDTPQVVEPPKPSKIAAQVTAVIKPRDGAVEGTNRKADQPLSVNTARSEDSTPSRIAQPGISEGALTQRSNTQKGVSKQGVAQQETSQQSGGAAVGKVTTPNMESNRLAINSMPLEKSGSAGAGKATGSAQLSVAPLRSKTAMQGGVGTGKSGEGRLDANTRLSAPTRIARAEVPSLVSQGQSASKMRVAPFNPGVNIVPPAKQPKLDGQQFAMRPPTTPVKSQTREGATITVAPSQQSLSFPTSYRARKGETLQQVALRYGLPADILASVNEVGVSEPLSDGQVVKLAQPVTVSFGGQPVVGDVSSMMMGNVAVTPFRFLFQKQGGSMTYDPIKHQVHATNATQEVTLTIGSDTALVNQKDVAMDLAAFLLSGRTMIPVRFFEKALHAQVEWTPATGRVYVAMTP